MGGCHSMPTRPSVASHYPVLERQYTWKGRGSWSEPDPYENTHTNVTSVNGPNRDAMPP
jgi:hypothetical protein